MIKWRKMLLSAVLGLSLLLTPCATAQAAGNCVEYIDSNIGAQNYTRTADVVRSYLTTASENRLMVVQSGTGIEGVAVAYYDSNYQFQSSVMVPAELPLFGAFYETETNYYLLTGQQNPNEKADVEVYRITKYDKSWNRISSAGLYDCNTTIPFRAGSARMVHQGKYLLIRTSHQMYKTSDGVNHQANVTIQVDTDTMQITDSFVNIMNSSCGYVSHSFNQFIRLEDNHIIALDHGDAYPRSAVLIKYPSDITTGKFYTRSCKAIDVLKFAGSIGNNATGASLGGLEISESSYLVAGNSVIQDSSNTSRKTRNVFVAAVDKKTNAVTLHWLTNYAEGSGTTSTPQMVQITSNQYMILWSADGLVYYTFVDGTGTQTGGTYQMEGSLSDCVPLVTDHKVIWYTWGNSKIVFYEISLNAPESVKQQGHETGHDYVSSGVGNDGYADLTCSVCGATDHRQVFTSLTVYYNTIGDGTYFPGAGRECKVGEKVYCLYVTKPDAALDAVKVTVDNPDVVEASYGDSLYDCILLAKAPGSATVTFSSVYNPSVSSTYKLQVVKGSDPIPDPDPTPDPTPEPSPDPDSVASQVVYRLYNPNSGEHLFTTDANETRVLHGIGWDYEGIAWTAPQTGVGVYRLYSPVTNMHLYTSDLNEVNTLVAGTAWQLDNGGNPMFYTCDGNVQNPIPIYRLYNSKERMHLLTTDRIEYNILGGKGWNQEGEKLSCLSLGDPSAPLP